MGLISYIETQPKNISGITRHPESRLLTSVSSNALVGFDGSANVGEVRKLLRF